MNISSALQSAEEIFILIFIVFVITTLMTFCIESFARGAEEIN